MVLFPMTLTDLWRSQHSSMSNNSKKLYKTILTMADQ